MSELPEDIQFATIYYIDPPFLATPLRLRALILKRQGYAWTKCDRLDLIGALRLPQCASRRTDWQPGDWNPRSGTPHCKRHGERAAMTVDFGAAINRRASDSEVQSD